MPWNANEPRAHYAHERSIGFAQTRSTTGRTVLVETNDRREAVELWRALGPEGYRMRWCPGPDARAGRDCTLVEDGSCPLVDGADVVLSHLDFTQPAQRETLAALGTKTQKPIIVAAPSFVRARFPEISDSGTAIPDRLTGHRALAAVRASLSARRPEQS